MLKLTLLRFLLTTCLLFGVLSSKGQSNIEYIKNMGQWEDHILYKADVAGGNIFIEENAKLTLVASEAANIHPHLEEAGVHVENEVFGRFAYQIQWQAANSNLKFKENQRSSTYHNYYLTKDAANWKGNVPLFAELYVEDLYPNIDWRIYSKGDLFEYDLVVHPNAKLNDVRLQYSGINSIKKIDGQLYLQTAIGEMVELAPIAYQTVDGKRQKTQVDFKVLADNTIGFEVKSAYDKSKPLIIDPILVFSTYSGSTDDNWGFTATYDNKGNHYTAGMVRGNGYPTTIGTFDTIWNGGESAIQTDVAITKYNADGTQQIYATYLGGSANEIPHSLIVNDDDELIVFGTTGSADFPVSFNAYDQSFNDGLAIFPANNINYLNGVDIFLTKFNEQGNNLVGSTYYGGTNNDGVNNSRNILEYNYGDFARGDLAILDDKVLLATTTFSDDIPVTPNTYKNNLDGIQDGLVAQFNDDFSQLEWSTYIGGSGSDAAYSIEIINNEIVIAGGTNSSDLQDINGQFSNFQGGQADGYILKLNLAGNSVLGGTYVGTDAYDQTYFVETDPDNNIYVLGQSLGDYPVSTNVYSVENASQFIHAFNNDLSSTIFSTVYGSQTSPGSAKQVNISPTAFLVDNCRKIYAIGWGGNVNNSYNVFTGNTFNMETTDDALISVTDGSDFYLIVLDIDASDLTYASYFGEFGGRGDHVDGGTSRFDKNGFVYHASCASCTGTQGFPVTDSAWSTVNPSPNCNAGSFKMQFEFFPLLAATDATPISGCPPLEVQFSNFSNLEGEDYFWDFDDGTTSTEEEPFHIFDSIGVYDVQFIIIDSANCVIADTATIQIIVTDTASTTVANFESNSIGCLQSSINFNNTSEEANNFLWDFGDGSTSIEENPSHTFSSAGDYEVTLYADPGSVCGDTITKTVSIVENTLEPEFVFFQTDCAVENSSIQFVDSSRSDLPIVSWIWSFGDGNISTQQNPIHQYDSSGTNNVTLSISDSAGCFSFVSAPIAYSTTIFETDFGFIQNCNPFSFGTQFVDSSSAESDVVEWQWDFGDGNTSNAENPNHFYSVADTFSVSLTSTNELGCSDSITKDVPVAVVNVNVNFSAIVECNNSVVQFTNNSSSEDSIVSYEWNFGDGNTSTETSPTYDFQSFGNFTVTLTATTASGCQSSSSAFIGIPFIDVNISVFTPSGCSNVNQGFFFQVTGSSSSGPTSALWDFGDGATASGFTASHSYSTPGNYDVTHIITNAQGCIDTVVEMVTISDSIIVNLEASTLDCGERSATFTPTFPTQDSIIGFTWDFGDGNMDSVNQSPTHQYVSVGTYVANFSFTTLAGCTSSGSIQVEIIDASIVADFEFQPQGCELRDIQLINNSAPVDSNTNFLWTFGNADSSSNFEPMYSYDSIGTYDITLIAANASCSDTVVQSISIVSQNNSLVDSVDICFGESVQLDLSDDFATIYNWAPDTFINDNSIQQPIVNPETTTQYVVEMITIAANGDSCFAYDSVTVVVNPLPIIEATSDQYEVEIGSTIQLNSTAGFVNYEWTPASAVSDANISNPTAEINEDSIFVVVGTDENGCKAIDTVNITILQTNCELETVFVPKAFTPNGDGQNDVLYVRVLGEVDRLDFRVYNRWGELVFETDDINVGWNGEYKSNLQGTDVFGYVLEIECDEEIVQRKGNITLVR